MNENKMMRENAALQGSKRLRPRLKFRAHAGDINRVGGSGFAADIEGDY